MRSSVVDRIVAASAALTILAAILALAGWALDIEVLRALIPGRVAMNPATAIALACCAVALALASRGVHRGLAQGLALIALAFGLIKFSAYIFDADVGIDRLLFSRSLDTQVGQPNRMAPNTALCFMLIGSSLWLFARQRFTTLAQALGLGTGFIAFFAVLGYVYGLAGFYRVSTYIPMALNTALAFTALSLGMLAARPHEGLASVFTSPAAGGFLARRLMPAAIAVPTILGGIRLWGQSAGLYSTQTGTVFMVVATVLLMTGLVGWTAKAVDRADRDRRAAIDALRENSEAKLHLAAIVDSSDDAIISKALDGTILSWNTGAEKLYGYVAEEIVGTPVYRLVPSDRSDEVPAVLALVRKGERVDHFETVRLTKEGHEVPVSLTTSPILDETGRVVAASAIARDITERKRAEQRVERLNKELEAFSYSVSHDLRAPLRGIVGFSQALLEDHAVRLDEDGQRLVARIISAGQRMGRLIDDLLAFSRLGRAEMSRRSVDLTALARDVERGLRETDPDREVEVAIAEGLRAEGDPQLLRAVLENLLGNAWKYTGKKARGRIEMGIEPSTNGGPATFFVKDDGAGFDMAYSDKLFEPFRRLHGAHEFDGTGIGLATVKRIVQRHGGRIWAQGAVGVGATFHFTLEEGSPWMTS